MDGDAKPEMAMRACDDGTRQGTKSRARVKGGRR
jgi:hypothetical protein